MDIGKGQSLKDFICVLPNILMQMPSVWMQNDFISTAGNALSHQSQENLD